MKHCAPHRKQHFHEERAQSNSCHYTTRRKVQWRCGILPLFLPMGIFPLQNTVTWYKNRDYIIEKANILSFQGPTASFAIQQ